MADLLPPAAADTDLGTLYNLVKRAFREADLPTPDLDARMLVTETLQVTTAQLIANPRLPIAQGLAHELCERARQRISGRSIGRILGRRAFWSLDLRLGPDTLEPRPETETVVELALSGIDPDRPAAVADLGVGTGAILLSVLTERPLAYGLGIDITEAALVAARRNAERHGLANRCGFALADFGAALAPAFDVVVCNPPYIPTAVIARLSASVRDNDPRVALDGGADGLNAYRAVFAQTAANLRPGGLLVVEIDPRALDAVLAEAARHGLVAQAVANDLNGDPRALSLRREHK